jgi:hypothetical protein
MTVLDLIELLSKYPPGYEVHFMAHEYGEASNISTDTDPWYDENGIVCLIDSYCDRPKQD